MLAVNEVHEKKMYDKTVPIKGLSDTHLVASHSNTGTVVITP